MIITDRDKRQISGGGNTPAYTPVIETEPEVQKQEFERVANKSFLGVVKERIFNYADVAFDAVFDPRGSLPVFLEDVVQSEEKQEDVKKVASFASSVTVQPIARSMLVGRVGQVQKLKTGKKESITIDPKKTNKLGRFVLGDAEIKTLSEDSSFDDPETRRFLLDTVDGVITMGTAGGWSIGKSALKGTFTKAFSQINKLPIKNKISQGVIVKSAETATKAVGRGVSGAAISTQFTLADEDKTLGDISKTGLAVGLAAAGVPVIGGMAFKYAGAKLSQFRKFMGPKYESLISSLEDSAFSQRDTVFSGVASDYERSFNRSTGFKSFMAKTALKTIKRAETLPDRWISRTAFTDAFKRQLATAGKQADESERLEKNMRLTLPAAAQRAARAQGVMDEIFLKASNHGISDNLAIYLKALDDLDTVRAGKQISTISSATKKIKTEAEILADLDHFAREWGDDTMKKLDEFKKGLQIINRSILTELYLKGVTTQKSFSNILKAHPNYLPHNVVVKAIDDGARKLGVLDSLNVSKSPLFARKGTDRMIEHPFIALKQRLPLVYATAERSRTMNTLSYLAQKNKDLRVFRGTQIFRSAKKAKRRKQLFEELAELRVELDRIKKTKTFANKKDRKLVSKMNKVYKKLNNNIQKALKELSEEAVDEAEKIDLQKIYDDIVNAEKQAGKLDLESLGERKTLEQAEALFKTKQKTRVKKAEKDLRLLDKEIDDLYQRLATGKTPGKRELNGIISRIKRKSAILSTIEDITGQEYKAPKKFLDSAAENISRRFEVAVDRKTALKQLKETIRKAKTQKKKISTKKIRDIKNFIRATGDEVDEDIARMLDPSASKKLSKLEESKAGIEKVLRETQKSSEEKMKQIKAVIEDLKKVKQSQLTDNQIAEKGLAKVEYFVRGEKEVLLVPKRIADAVKNLEFEQTGPAIKMLIRLSGSPLLRKLATQKNPGFIFANPFRDVQSAYVNSPYGISAEAFVNMLFQKNPDLLNDTASYGAFMGAGITQVDDYAKLIANNLEGSFWHKIKSKDPTKQLDEIAARLENATRNAVYHKARNAGASKTEAAFLSRNASIDFGRIGSVMAVVNKFVPFLNARIQGSAQLWRAFKKNPEDVLHKLYWTAAYPEMMLYNHNRKFESYPSVPQHVIDRHWVIMVGEAEGLNDRGETVKIPQMVSIPKGEPQKLVSNTLNHFLKKADRIDRRGTTEVLLDVVGSLSPVPFNSFQADDFVMGIASSLGPTVRIGFGIATNKDPWTGYDIVPDDGTATSRIYAKPEFQFKRGTTETAKAMSKLMNISPAYFEFYADAFGGLPKQALQATDLVTGKAKPSASRTTIGTLSRTPITKKFIRETVPRETVEASKMKQVFEEIRPSIANEKASKNIELNMIIEQIVQTRPANRSTVMNELIEQGLINDSNAKKVLDRLTKAVTYTDAQLRQLGVESGGLAIALNDYFSILSPEKKASEMERLIKNGIITDTVAKQLVYLMQRDKTFEQE